MTSQKTTETPRTTSRKAECKAPGCTRKPTRAKLCDAHYDTRRDLADRPKKG